MFEDLLIVLNQVLNPMVRDGQNSGYSWNHCYGFFQNRHADFNQNDMQLACLHLGFYLASWGMYRSGGIRYKDYRIYEGIINILLRHDYQAVWQPHYYDGILTGENEITQYTPQIQAARKLYSEIELYINRLKSRNNNGDERAISATETLITKILLGTTACVPAYDDYFKKGLKSMNMTQSFKTGFPKLLKRCRREQLLQELDNGYQQNGVQIFRQNSIITICIGNTNFQFPLMKVIDMYFWGKGFYQNNPQDGLGG